MNITLKPFSELSQREIFAFAAFNDLPITNNKREQLKREYEKALARGIVTDSEKLMRLRLERVPLLVENKEALAA